MTEFAAIYAAIMSTIVFIGVVVIASRQKP